MARKTFEAKPGTRSGVDGLELIKTYHWGPHSSGDVWELSWEEAEALAAVLGEAIAKHNRPKGDPPPVLQDLGRDRYAVTVDGRRIGVVAKIRASERWYSELESPGTTRVVCGGADNREAAVEALLAVIR